MTHRDRQRHPQRPLDLGRDEADLGFLGALENEDHREREEHARCHKTGAASSADRAVSSITRTQGAIRHLVGLPGCPTSRERLRPQLDRPLPFGYYSGDVLVVGPSGEEMLYNSTFLSGEHELD
jgi:hypothetical protein